MTSRRLSLTALSCALVSAGCSQSVSSTREPSQSSRDGLQQATADLLARASQLEGLRQRRSNLALMSPEVQGVEQFWPESTQPEGFASAPLQPGVASAEGEKVTPSRTAASRANFNRTEPARTEQANLNERHWSDGVSAGYGASVAEQTAVTDTDWNRVVSQWKAAIARLDAIPTSSSRYLDAQTKLAIYRSALERAEGQYIAVVQNRYVAMSLPEKNAPETSLLSSVVAESLNAPGTPNASDASAIATNPSSPEMGVDADGQRLREWLEAGDFDAVEQLLQEAIDSDRRTQHGLDYADAVLVNAVSQHRFSFTRHIFKRLNEWVFASPDSSLAYGVRSYFTQAYLWEDVPLQVGQRRKKCPPTAQDLERLAISASDVEQALSLDPDNPIALTSKLRLTKIGLLDKEDGDAFEEAFQALNAVSPGSFQAHLEKASYLLSQDRSGEGQQVLGFLRQSVAQAPEDSALPMLLPVMHINIANLQENAREYLSQPQIWQEIQTQSDRVLKQLPQAVPYSELVAQLADKTGHRELARRYQQIAINRSVAEMKGSEAGGQVSAYDAARSQIAASYASQSSGATRGRQVWPKVMMNLL